MTTDAYATCTACGKTYHVCEGHNCEYGTYVPAVDYTRVTVEDNEGNEVEVRTENG
jgi:hypothetical protein